MDGVLTFSQDLDVDIFSQVVGVDQRSIFWVGRLQPDGALASGVEEGWEDGEAFSAWWVAMESLPDL
jgi:hypothetical protein